MGGTYRPPSESGLSVSSKSKRTTLNSTLFSFIFLFNIVLFFYITHMHQFSSARDTINTTILLYSFYRIDVPFHPTILVSSLTKRNTLFLVPVFSISEITRMLISFL